MTKDEIRARIAQVKAELDGLEAGAGDAPSPEGGAKVTREGLERELASLKAELEEL